MEEISFWSLWLLYEFFIQLLIVKVLVKKTVIFELRWDEKLWKAMAHEISINKNNDQENQDCFAFVTLNLKWEPVLKCIFHVLLFCVHVSQTLIYQDILESRRYSIPLFRRYLLYRTLGKTIHRQCTAQKWEIAMLCLSCLFASTALYI